MLQINGLATLPLNPNHHTRVGFYSFATYLESEMLSGQADKSLLGINLVGSDDLTQQTQNADILVGKINSLGIFNVETLIDSDTREEVLAQLLKLKLVGHIRDTKREILQCACGKVYIPHGARVFSIKNSNIKNGYSTCCNTILEVKNDLVLELRVLENSDASQKISPYFVAEQFKKERDKFYYSGLVISRQKETLLMFQGYYIDNDIFWMLWLNTLRMRGMRISKLLSGVSTIRQAAIASVFVNETLKEIIFIPKINFLPHKDCDNLEKIVGRFGPDAVKKALLSKALSKRDVITLSGTELPKHRS